MASTKGFDPFLPANSSAFRHRYSWRWRSLSPRFCSFKYTALGEQIIAVGGNEEAARLSGINTDRVKICVYVISGLLSSIAGFVLIGRVGAAEPIGGNGFELQAIGAAVIGGASLFGGEGNPLGSLIGALTLGAMQNGLTLNECARPSGNS